MGVYKGIARNKMSGAAARTGSCKEEEIKRCKEKRGRGVCIKQTKKHGR